MLKKHSKNLNKNEENQNVETEEPTVFVDVEPTALDDYMRQTFGCDATDAADLPSDEPSLSVIFEGAK